MILEFPADSAQTPRKSTVVYVRIISLPSVYLIFLDHFWKHSRQSMRSVRAQRYLTQSSSLKRPFARAQRHPLTPERAFRGTRTKGCKNNPSPSETTLQTSSFQFYPVSMHLKQVLHGLWFAFTPSNRTLHPRCMRRPFLLPVLIWKTP